MKTLVPVEQRATTARIALVTLLALGGCRYGPGREPIAMQEKPTGATAIVRVQHEQGTREGELFAVDSIGVIIKQWRSVPSSGGFRVDRAYIVRVRWERIDRMWVREFGWGEGRTGADVAVSARQGDFPSIGRFPQGLRGELLGRVLALLGQRELEELQ